MADRLKVALIGAGSRSFGPATVRDALLSEPIAERGVDLVLMDIAPERLPEIAQYAEHVKRALKRDATVQSTGDLDAAVDGADFVVTAVDVNRFLYWSQDYHVPRKHGFKQVFGENGGPGGLFHALRNFTPMLGIARAMERLCPKALLLNFTNPEHKTCEAVTRLTSIQAIGLCHGVFMGLHQVARILGMDTADVEGDACGINHFTWFQTLRDKRTGEDLYPRLREAEREGDWLADWHEIGLARVLFRRFGLWPSPAANHYGEYLGWAEEFVASELQYFYDPVDGHPWETNDIPEFVYTIDQVNRRPWRRENGAPSRLEDAELRPSGELAVPIMEALACGQPRYLAAVNVPNRGAMPDMPDGMVVEVPADADGAGIRPRTTTPLPEAIAAMLRVQGSINKLLVEAYAEGSRDKLIQAMLLDPTVNSYRRAVECVDELLRLQSDRLPTFA